MEEEKCADFDEWAVFGRDATSESPPVVAAAAAEVVDVTGDIDDDIDGLDYRSMIKQQRRELEELRRVAQEASPTT